MNADIIRDMFNKGTLKTIDNVRAMLTGKVSTYGNEDVDMATHVNSFVGLWDEIIAGKKASTAETYRNARDCFIRSGVYNPKDGYNVDVDKVKDWVEWMTYFNCHKSAFFPSPYVI